MPSLARDDAREVRAILGGTVNDVLLATVAGALRTLLLERGDVIPDAIRVFVPVNVRTEAARGTYGNRVTLVLCPVPLSEPDPVARLRRISAETRRLKSNGQATGVLAFTHLGELAPPVVAGEAIRIVLALHPFHLVVSNIPGPPTARWLLGRRLAACHPAIPLARGQSLSVGLLSYAGTIGVGLLGGADRERDLGVLAAAVPAALAELVAAARAAGAAAPARGHG
jgi:WS/DGAT/MGAT family acyltransferase